MSRGHKYFSSILFSCRTPAKHYGREFKRRNSDEQKEYWTWRHNHRRQAVRTTWQANPAQPHALKSLKARP
jgi:hypothetical protein